MITEIERRRNPRISADWPVVLKTPYGAIRGKTANISISGLALLLFSETPEIDDEFQIALKSPEGPKLSVNCEKIWSDSINLDGTFYSGIGVRFTKISSSDREIIATMVKEYYLI